MSKMLKNLVASNLNAHTQKDTSLLPPQPSIEVLGEVKRMAEDLHIEHGQVAVSAAGLLLLTTRLLKQVEITAGEDMSQLLLLQRACIASWVREAGVPSKDVENALAGLDRACVTVDYLSTIPL